MCAVKYVAVIFLVIFQKLTGYQFYLAHYQCAVSTSTGPAAVGADRHQRSIRHTRTIITLPITLLIRILERRKPSIAGVFGDEIATETGNDADFKGIKN